MSRPPRLHGFPYVGRYDYFLTFCTRARAPVLRDPSTADIVIAQIRRTARARSFAITAYCVMPDHVHLLLEGRSASADLRGFAKQLKQSTGQRFARQQGQSLWQEGYYDRVLRPTESAAMMARYIIENPVRAGLVDSALDYPYLGSDVWSLEEILNTAL